MTERDKILSQNMILEIERILCISRSWSKRQELYQSIKDVTNLMIAVKSPF
jgi:hypothetical protein